MSTVCEPLIIHLMEGLSMAPSLGLAVEGFHGVEAVAGSSAVGEGSVDGNSKEWVAWGPSMEPNGDQSKFLGIYLLKVDPHYSLFSGRYQYSSLKTF